MNSSSRLPSPNQSLLYRARHPTTTDLPIGNTNDLTGNNNLIDPLTAGSHLHGPTARTTHPADSSMFQATSYSAATTPDYNAANLTSAVQHGHASSAASSGKSALATDSELNALQYTVGPFLFNIEEGRQWLQVLRPDNTPRHAVDSPKMTVRESDHGYRLVMPSALARLIAPHGESHGNQLTARDHFNWLMEQTPLPTIEAAVACAQNLERYLEQNGAHIKYANTDELTRQWIHLQPPQEQIANVRAIMNAAAEVEPQVVAQQANADFDWAFWLDERTDEVRADKSDPVPESESMDNSNLPGPSNKRGRKLVNNHEKVRSQERLKNFLNESNLPADQEQIRMILSVLTRLRNDLTSVQFLNLTGAHAQNLTKYLGLRFKPTQPPTRDEKNLYDEIMGGTTTPITPTRLEEIQKGFLTARNSYMQEAADRPTPSHKATLAQMRKERTVARLLALRNSSDPRRANDKRTLALVEELRRIKVFDDNLIKLIFGPPNSRMRTRFQHAFGARREVPLGGIAHATDDPSWNIENTAKAFKSLSTKKNRSVHEQTFLDNCITEIASLAQHLRPKGGRPQNAHRSPTATQMALDAQTSSEDDSEDGGKQNYA